MTPTPPTRVMVINAGSTSLKVSVVERDEVVWRGASLEDAPLDGIDAVGHRVVHDGGRFEGPAVIDDRVLADIRAAAEFAPLHNQAALDGIDAARDALGRAGRDVPHVAVFDTTFHRTIPPEASAYGVPRDWFERGLRRYGFHGTSHEWSCHRAAEQLDRAVEDLCLVTCHLGGGCSITAVDGGRSVDTTMGLTPLDGVVMASRSGSVDPGLLLHVLRTGMAIEELDEVLEHRSGLLGLSQVSADLREVVAARDERGDEHARFAIDVFVHHLARAVGAVSTSLPTVDALVFTGGIGENSEEIRSRVSSRGARNGDVPVLVVPAEEDRAIAAIVRRTLLATG